MSVPPTQRRAMDCQDTTGQVSGSRSKKNYTPFRVQPSETAEIGNIIGFLQDGMFGRTPLNEHYTHWIILSNICVVWLDI